MKCDELEKIRKCPGGAADERVVRRVAFWHLVVDEAIAELKKEIECLKEAK